MLEFFCFFKETFFWPWILKKTKNGENTKIVFWTTNLHENSEKKFQAPANTRSFSMKNPGKSWDPPPPPES